MDCNSNDNKIRRSDVYHINWFDVDYTGKLRFTSLCQYLEETAWRHADCIGIGYDAVQEQDNIWVIVRMKIELLSLPGWNEDIKVTTWARGIDKLFALRDYSIEDLQGNVVARATTTWMILDAKTHRPVNPELVKQALAYTYDEKVFNENAEKIANPPFTEGRLFHSITVSYADVDFNGHAGNVRYPEWIMAGLPYNDLKGKAVKSFAVNYITEALANDVIDLYLFDNDANVRVSGVRRTDSKLIFTAVLDIS